MSRADHGDLDGALADLDIAQELEPQHPDVLNDRARFYAQYRHDKLDEAEQLALRALEGASDRLVRAIYLDTLAWVYFEQERYADAVAVLEEAIILATVEGKVVYATLLIHLENSKAAMQ